MSRELVAIARKMNRQLDIGKGISLDAGRLALLAAIGVNDLIQQKAAEYVREQARLTSMRRGTIAAASFAKLAQVGEPAPPPAADKQSIQVDWADVEPPLHIVRTRTKPTASLLDAQTEWARARSALMVKHKLD